MKLVSWALQYSGFDIKFFSLDHCFCYPHTAPLPGKKIIFVSPSFSVFFSVITKGWILSANFNQFFFVCGKVCNQHTMEIDPCLVIVKHRNCEKVLLLLTYRELQTHIFSTILVLFFHQGLNRHLCICIEQFMLKIFAFVRFAEFLIGR